MTITRDTFHCPHCGHSISGQEPSTRELFSYIEQLESFALMPTIWRKMLREGSDFLNQHRLFAVLVARMDHYINLLDQCTADTLVKEKAEMYAELLNRVLEAIIPIIDQRGGSILELQPESILAAWGIPLSEDDFTKAVSTALEIQERLLSFQEEHADDRDFALKIGIAGGFMYVGTIGTSNHRSFAIIGSSAIKAARLSVIAEPGQTLVDQSIYKWTEDVIVYEQPTTKSEFAESGIQPQHYVALKERIASV